MRENQLEDGRLMEMAMEQAVAISQILMVAGLEARMIEVSMLLLRTIGRVVDIH